jgi:hypothetical protein
MAQLIALAIVIVAIPAASLALILAIAGRQ